MCKWLDKNLWYWRFSYDWGMRYCEKMECCNKISHSSSKTWVNQEIQCHDGRGGFIQPPYKFLPYQNKVYDSSPHIPCGGMRCQLQTHGLSTKWYVISSFTKKGVMQPAETLTKVEKLREARLWMNTLPPRNQPSPKRAQTFTRSELLPVYDDKAEPTRCKNSNCRNFRSN